MMEPQLSVDAGPAPTDADALERLRRFGGGKLLRDMIALFLVSAPERLTAARAAMVAENLSSTELALHSLKSSSAQLGAMRMHRLCDEGERRMRDGSLAGVPALIDELEQEFARVREWLTNARDEGTP
ncbi:MAG: Hpt domain-containing protein [Gemmatimonadaceae bacterium]|nr:Hpt domain-containing protein [Gemmatimonadaceae bacterium]